MDSPEWAAAWADKGPMTEDMGHPGAPRQPGLAHSSEGSQGGDAEVLEGSNCPRWMLGAESAFRPQEGDGMPAQGAGAACPQRWM